MSGDEVPLGSQGVVRGSTTSVVRVDSLTVSTAPAASGLDGQMLLDGVSIEVARGSTLGIVGESGSGKTLTAMTIMGLLPPGVTVVGGSVRVQGVQLSSLDSKAYRRVRGTAIAMVFQDPASSLNPALTVGEQIAETARHHLGLDRRAARAAAVQALDAVGVPGAAQRSRAYPHELSGGMRQRVSIAMAIVCKPALLIADEPTTALDTTIQAQILDLLAEMRDALEMSLLLISHDLGVVAEACDRVAVMYAGQIVEEGRIRDVFSNPAHPYTSALIAMLLRERGRDVGHGLLAPPTRRPADGCRFRTRCAFATSECQGEQHHREIAPGHAVRCCRASSLQLVGVA